MARAGEIIENPVTRERVVFTATGADSGGELLRFEMTVASGSGSVAPLHAHPKQQAEFHIRSGEITLRVDGGVHVLGAGESFCVPAGRPHAWWNSGTEPLRAVLEIRPASRLDELMVSVFALAQDGRVDARGRPGWLQSAVMLDAYRDSVRLTGPRGRLQDMGLAGLARLGRALGLRADYPYPGRSEAE